MEYWIKRGEAQFGPYSLAGLQQYLNSGNLTRDDLARSEGMTDWIPLGQVLGSVPVPQAQPTYGIQNWGGQQGFAQAGYAAPIGVYGGAAAQPAVYPAVDPAKAVDLPANLPWWALLLLAFVPIASLILLIWPFILAGWARRLSGKSTALVCFWSFLGSLVLFGVLIAIAANLGNSNSASGVFGILAMLCYVAAIALAIGGHFAIRSAMEQYYNTVENIGLKLSGVMVFFFNIFYFQYHVNRIYEMKQGSAPVPYGR